MATMGKSTHGGVLGEEHAKHPRISCLSRKFPKNPYFFATMKDTSGKIHLTNQI